MTALHPNVGELAPRCHTVALSCGDESGFAWPPELTRDAPVIRGAAFLGRSVIVAGGAAPEPWATCDRIVIDEASLTAPDDAVRALHAAWSTRTPVVIDLRVDPTRFRKPETSDAPIESLDPGFSFAYDALHFLVWANSYDARADGEPIWWWGRKAASLGATEGGARDVTLPDGSEVWIDGGPRLSFDETVVHSDSIDLKRLPASTRTTQRSMTLAPDQEAAVTHAVGPARIIAPAGSGKTRVLTERYRVLLGERGYERDSTLALAYNKKAQEEMGARLDGLGARIETLNAWGYSLLRQFTGSAPRVLDEPDVRTIIDRLLPRRQRRLNTDPIAPYIDGLSLIRLGLRDPYEVESSLDDVDGLAELYPRYRAELRRRGVIDFDEQIFGALEAMVRNGEFRRVVQQRHRHLLVDEFQDLTPAHVLLVRLAAGPAADVFGVGDDDQTIYGHAGASPRFLIDYTKFFPGAAEYELGVNYRCPAPVTNAAATLLGYNTVRVPKHIAPGPSVVTSDAAMSITRHSAESGASELVELVQQWTSEGAPAENIAVLARVNSLLLAPHVALAEAGVPINSILGPWVLDRSGTAAALAYLRIAASPDALRRGDLTTVSKRPSRGLPQWAAKWLDNCKSIDGVRAAAQKIDDAKVQAKFDALADDLDSLAGLAERGTSTRQLLVVIRDSIGLGTAMSLLDSTGSAGGSNLDDIEALLQVADLQPDPTKFEPWLRQTFHAENDPSGVVLSTIHRVKGREWPRVIVFGVNDGIIPHRLAEDFEEERRVLHVGITRSIEATVVFAERTRASDFIDELNGVAEKAVARAPKAVAAPKPKTAAAANVETVVAAVGMRLKTTAGFEGEIIDERAEGVGVRIDGGSTLMVCFGERVLVDGRSVVLKRQVSEASTAAAAALREWRTARSKADGVPAYVVLNDKYLDGIAEAMPSNAVELRQCDGIGPAKLETYGDEILEILDSVRGLGSTADG